MTGGSVPGAEGEGVTVREERLRPFPGPGSLGRSQAGRDSALVHWTRPGSPVNPAGTAHGPPGSSWVGPALQAQDARSAGICMAHDSLLHTQVISESTPSPPTLRITGFASCSVLCIYHHSTRPALHRFPCLLPSSLVRRQAPGDNCASAWRAAGVQSICLLVIFGGIVLLLFLLEYRMCMHAKSL